MSPEDMGIDTSRRNPSPRPLSDNERARLEEYIDSIHYSTRYAALAHFREGSTVQLLTLPLLTIATPTANTSTATSSYPRPCLRPFPPITTISPRAL